MNLITGDLLICEGRSLIAKGISIFTRSKITHTANVVVINDKVYIIEAQRKGIHLLPFQEWKKKYKYNFHVYRKNNILNRDVWEKHYLLRSLSQLGKKYDFGLLLGSHPKEIIEDYINPNNKNEIPTKYENNGKFVCSEFSMWTYRFPKYWEFTPKMVYDFVKDINNNFIFIDYVDYTTND